MLCVSSINYVIDYLSQLEGKFSDLRDFFSVLFIAIYPKLKIVRGAVWVFNMGAQYFFVE
jgi:hypothetical protein